MTALPSYEASPGLIELGGAQPGVVAKMTHTGRVFLLNAVAAAGRPDNQRPTRAAQEGSAAVGFSMHLIEEVRDDDRS